MSPLDRAVQHARRIAGPDPAGDRQLLAAFAATRDQAAFAELVRRHGALVRGVCRRVLGADTAADDAFQATFLLLARKAGASGWGESLAGWLHATARHVAAKARRAAERRRRREAQVPPRPEGPDPAAAVAWRELCGILDEEVARLPEQLRGPLALCYLEGRTRDEAARALGWPLGTLKRRLARGRALLRARLTRRGVTLAAAGLPVAAIESAVSAATVTTTATAATAFVNVGAVSTAVGKLIGCTGPALGVKLSVAVSLLVAAGALAIGTARLAAPTQPPTPPTSTQAGIPAAPVVQSDQFTDTLPAGALARFGTLAFRHGDSVQQVLASPDGRTVFSLGYRTLRIWQADSGREDGAIVAPERATFMRCALLPGGDTLALSYMDGSIHIWDWRTRRELRRIDVAVTRQHTLLQPSYAFAPDGRSLVIVDKDDGVTLIELTTGRKLLDLSRPYGGATSMAFAPDSKTLLTACQDKSVRVWDVTTGKEVAAYTGLTDAIRIMALSPDGRWLATVSSRMRETQTRETKTADGFTWSATIPETEKIVRIWDLTTSREVHQLDAGAFGAMCLLFAPDSRSLVIGLGANDGRVVRQWDVTTGKVVREFPGHCGAVTALAFTADGRTLVTANTVIRLWDWQTGRERLALPGHSGSLSSAAFLPDGKTAITSGSDGSLRFWDPTNGQELRRFAGPGKAVSGFALSPDGRTLATTSRFNRTYDLSVWDAATGRLVRELRSAPDMLTNPVFSPDGRALVVGGYGDKAVRFWDTGNWQEQRRVESPGPLCLVYALDGRTLLGVGGDGSSGGESSAFAINTATGNIDVRFSLGPTGYTYCRVYSPGGKYLAIGGHRGNPNPASEEDRGFIRLYDIAVGREPRELWVRNDVSSLAFSPDGRLLASGGWSDDPTVAVWDVVTGKRLREFAGLRGRVLALAFSPDGTRLISGGEDTTALVWHVSDVRPADR